jgi:class 3 adenylate cyclase
LIAAAIPGSKLIELPGDDHYWVVGNDDIAEEVEAFLTGERPRPRTDRVLTTVLFTDIVGSTERASALGDHEWKLLLERHDAILRREIEMLDGREIDTAGDGFFATFDGPARAVRCALAIGGAVRTLGLEIRAGCHTGEVELRGDDVAGIAVHIGARISALAGPSQVLVSSTVKELVAGSGLAFQDAGEHELKGVPDRWHLFRVAS